jgi:hypothetical protein
MSVAFSLRFATFACLGLVGAACSGADSTTPSATKTASLRVVGSRTVSDTISAQYSVIAVEYTDSTGARKSGTRIRFTLVTDSTRAIDLASPQARADSIEVVTDTAGRASAVAIFLSRAGTARIRANVVGTNLRDSILVTTRPGRPRRIVVTPYDTALLVNATVQLSARVFDRQNNVRVDAVSWSSSTGLTIDSRGLARGSDYARAVVRATADGFTDSSYLSVVPQGTIAAVREQTTVGTERQFEMFNTDGSNTSQIPITIAPSCSAVGLRWSATGDSVLFAGGHCHYLKIFKATFPGAQMMVAPTIASEYELWPSFSRDGRFIYFIANPGGQNGEVWRMRSDGSAAQRVGPAARDFFDLDQYPTESPDGSTILFSSNRKYRRNERPTVQLLNIATGEVRESGLEGSAPSWSPQGDRIAFHAVDQYAVANADGTGVRLLSKSRYSIWPDPPSWSPDGRWIVTVGVDPKSTAPVYGRIEIINVQSGLVLPLAWTSRMVFPAWRPK